MAGGVRQQRVAHVITRVIGVLLIGDLADTPLSAAVVQRVQVSPDLRVATLYYTLYDASMKQEVAKQFEQHARFIRGRVAKELRHLRSVPEIRFAYDEASEKLSRLESLLEKEKRLIEENKKDEHD